MMTGLRSPLLAAVSLLVGVHLGADEPSPLTAGTRIRLTTTGAAPGEKRTVTGTLLGHNAETVTVNPTKLGGGEVIPRSSIAALEVSKGRHRSKGALIGGAIGLAVGIGLVASGDRGIGCGGGECLCGGGGCGALYLGVGGAAAAIGAGIGALAARERWEAVPLGKLGRRRPMDPPMVAVSDHVSFGMAADRSGGFGLSCRVGF
jgi:hypothetical protein